MNTYTVKDRSLAMLVTSTALIIPAHNGLPRFYGRLDNRVLISDDLYKNYRVSFEELRQIKRIRKTGVDGLITPPKSNFDSWFIKPEHNFVFVNDSYKLDITTVKKLITFGGVQSKKNGNFIFASKTAAFNAYASVVANKKVTPKSIMSVSHLAHKLFTRMDEEGLDLTGESALIINPNDSGLHLPLLRSNCAVSVCELSQLKQSLFKKRGCQIVGDSIYRLHKSFMYDYCIMFTDDTYEFSELILKLFNHCSQDGRIIAIAPKNWQKSKHPQANVVIEMAAMGLSEELQVSDEYVLLMFDKSRLCLQENQKTDSTADTIVSEQ